MSKLFAGFSDWDWVEIASVLAVFIGAIGTLILRFKKPKSLPDKNGLIPIKVFFLKEKLESKRAKWETAWELLLVFGLFFELRQLGMVFQKPQN